MTRMPKENWVDMETLEENARTKNTVAGFAWNSRGTQFTNTLSRNRLLQLEVMFNDVGASLLFNDWYEDGTTDTVRIVPLSQTRDVDEPCDWYKAVMLTFKLHFHADEVYEGEDFIEFWWD